jgi:protein TonB
MKTKIHTLFSRNWSEVTGGERNEIVFERLNKTYGAYEIRTNYDNTLVKSFSATGLLILLLAAVFFITKSIPTIEVNIPDTGTEVIFHPPVNPDIPKIPEQPKTNASSAPNTAQLKPVVTDEIINPDDNIIPKNTDNNSKGTGNPVDTGSSQTFIPSGPGPELPKIDSVYDFPDKMPNFPGGEDELTRYLKSNTRIPEVIRQIGNIKEKVGVSFTIEKDGSISSIALIHDGCKYAPLNNEAVRVVKKMPTWEPGEQHGTPVRVRLILPMRFEVK